MSFVKPITRKSFKIRPSGRSSDFISPSFGYGCLLECAYCYMKRHMPKGLNYATNINSILDEIHNHSLFAYVDKPNQTDPKYITYDIACNEDFAFHSKFYDWQKIFEFFVEHEKAKATFATKVIPEEFLKFNPQEKVRIRFSLMPQRIASILEPNTPDIKDRIKAINTFRKAGYDVHINYSPVVYYNEWLEDYTELFNLVDSIVDDQENVLAEVIFLTHNYNKHKYNLDNHKKAEKLLWKPSIQENKTSNYGGMNIRYKRQIKYNLINDFKDRHSAIVPWNKIRYIF